MKKFVLATILFSSAFAAAAEKCYQVSSFKDLWSRTPELLCIDGTPPTNNYTITLKTGLPMAQKTVATFYLNLLMQARCQDCNRDHYGLANPSNSTFNSLGIRFNGHTDPATQKEEGSLSIGSTQLYYRSL